MTEHTTEQGAREALVEQLAEAIEDAAEQIGVEDFDHNDARIIADSVQPLVAAQVEAAVSVVRAETQAEFDRLEGRILGDEQCCLDTCNGGACESCPGCCAGWCINGHDFQGTGEWERMDDEDRERWFDVAREHNEGLNAALARAEAAESEVRALREKVARVEALAALVPPTWSDDTRDNATDNLLEAIATLAAPSPAEGTGEDPADVTFDRMPKSSEVVATFPAPVSSGEAAPPKEWCPVCDQRVDQPHLRDCDYYVRPAPVVTPSAEDAPEATS